MSRTEAEASPRPASRILYDTQTSGAPPRAATDGPPTSQRHPYEVLHTGNTDLVAYLGPCLIIVSHTMTPAGVDAIGRGFAKLVARHERVCSISFVERRAGSGSSAEVREMLAQVARKYTKSMTGAAVVCEGTGFRATAVRSVVTAIHMASRASHPVKVFSCVEAGLEWLASTPVDGFDRPLLAEATATLRERLLAKATAATGASSGG